QPLGEGFPPQYVVPYRVLPDKIKPARGMLPSWKVWRFVKPVASELTANTIPSAPVPYKVPFDKIRVPCGRPSRSLRYPLKSWSVVTPVPSVLTANTVPPPKLPPTIAVPYRVLPDRIKPAIGCAPPSLVAPGPPVNKGSPKRANGLK